LTMKVESRLAGVTLLLAAATPESSG